MKKSLTKDELKHLRNLLPPGAVEKIANETGFAVSSVRQILYKPERFNKTVLDKAIALGEIARQEILEMKSKIKSIS